MPPEPGERLALNNVQSAAKEHNAIGAVVLAAGSGTRLGNRPKCLLELDGISLIRHQVTALQVLGVAHIVVVLGHHKEQIAAQLKGLAVDIVEQPEARHAQSSSVRLGVGRLPESLEGILVCPSDLPLLGVDDYQSVIQVFMARSPEIEFVGPEVNAIPGHPVLFDCRVRQRIAGGDPAYGSGGWRGEPDTGVLRWRNSNTHFILDVDTQQDIDALEKQTGHRLRWPAAAGDAKLTPQL